MKEEGWKGEWVFVKFWVLSHDRRNEIFQAFEGEPWPVKIMSGDFV